MSEAAAVETPEEGASATASFADFGAGFQSKIAALAIRDTKFNERVEGLLKPEYFTNEAEAALVAIGLEFYETYSTTPDIASLAHLVKERVDRKAIPKSLVPDVRAAIHRLRKVELSDRDFVADKVGEFAQYQALTEAVIASVDHIEKRDFAKVQQKIERAMQVGTDEAAPSAEFFGDIADRTALRKARASGDIKRNGVTTGIRPLDKILYHNGWGRREFTLLMGGPKVGKSTALGFFAKNAALAGYNVLLFTLEVSRDIYLERMDAALTGIPMVELESRIMEVEEKVSKAAADAGKLIVTEYPSGMMKPSHIRRTINRYRSQGIVFDMVVVDYADLMAPEVDYREEIANSKHIYTDLRAIASMEDVAMLSATQTNREGAKSDVARMDHVAEDFNRIRIADLVISINRTEEEKERDEARLFFAASRNQRGDFAVRIKQRMDAMQFVTKWMGAED